MGPTTHSFMAGDEWAYFHKTNSLRREREREREETNDYVAVLISGSGVDSRNSEGRFLFNCSVLPLADDDVVDVAQMRPRRRREEAQCPRMSLMGEHKVQKHNPSDDLRRRTESEMEFARHA